MDISDFITEADDTPVLGCFIDGGCNVRVQGLALFEDVVECELTWKRRVSALLDQGLKMQGELHDSW